MFCRYCGKEIKDDAKFCRYCGKDTQIPEVSNPKQEVKKEKNVALVMLCVMLCVLLVLVGGLIVAKVVIENRNSIRQEEMDERDRDDDRDNDRDNNKDEIEDGQGEEHPVSSAETEPSESIVETSAEAEGELVVSVPTEEMLIESSVEASEVIAVPQYILPESDSRFLTKADLIGFTQEECRLARNELFARHGRIFQDEVLREHFENCDWYQGTVLPEEFDEAVFNEYEIANRDLIVEFEKEQGYR